MKLECHHLIKISIQRDTGHWLQTLLKNQILLDTESSVEELDIKSVIDDLLRKLEGKLEIIKEICKENNGEVCFEIVPIFEKDNLPAIYFEKRFLNIVNYSDAVIDIDMYLN